MTDEKFSELFESSRAGRQREQFVLQHGTEPRPEQIDGPAEESSDVRIRHGRQLVKETEESITALLNAMENGQIDVGNDAMRDAVKNELRRLHDLLARSTQSLRQMEAGDVEVMRNERGADAISRFIQFSEALKRRIGAKSEELRHREEQYRSGQLTDAEYQRVILEREEYQDAMEREIREHAEGVDASDPLFVETLQYLQKELAPLPSLEPGERLERLWGNLERQLLPFVGAYNEIVLLFRQGRAQEEDVREAWQEKRGAYERICSRVFKLRGLTPVEAAELEERARSVVRPDEPPSVTRTEPQPSVAGSEQGLPELEAMKREEYDERIREMLKSVDDLVQVADAQEREGTLDDAARRDLLDQLREFPTKLYELDERAEEPGASRERPVLIEMMRKLRERLLAGDFYVRPPTEELAVSSAGPVDFKPIPNDEHGFIVKEERPTGDATAVSAIDARRAYDEAKRAYAAVQHQLTPEQRRDIRARLVGLNRTVRQAELAHVVARAMEHAPSVAHAALASMPRAPRFEVRTPASYASSPSKKMSRGIWGVLTDAFRLR